MQRCETVTGGLRMHRPNCEHPETRGFKLYMVTSPEYMVTSAGLYDPPEYDCDVFMVEARNKRDAVMLGVQEILRTQQRSYAETSRGDETPPWTGYRAEEVPPCSTCGDYESCSCLVIDDSD